MGVPVIEQAITNTQTELGKYQIFNTQEYWGEYLSIDIESMCDTKSLKYSL